MRQAHIPDDYRSLLTGRAMGHLATLDSEGRPQLTPVWVEVHGHPEEDCVLVNSAAGRIKNRNMRSNPNVAIEIQAPDNSYRYLSITGVVNDITLDPGPALERLSQRYLGKPYPWWGPDEQREVFHIRPTRVIARDLALHNRKQRTGAHED